MSRSVMALPVRSQPTSPTMQSRSVSTLNRMVPLKFSSCSRTKMQLSMVCRTLSLPFFLRFRNISCCVIVVDSFIDLYHHLSVMLVNGFHFFRSSELQFKNQLADVGLPLKCFDKQRVPFFIRRLWAIPLLPVNQ